MRRRENQPIHGPDRLGPSGEIVGNRIRTHRIIQLGGAPAAGAGLWKQAKAWMPKRSGHAESGGREGLRERPVMRQGHPRAGDTNRVHHRQAWAVAERSRGTGSVLIGSFSSGVPLPQEPGYGSKRCRIAADMQRAEAGMASANVRRCGRDTPEPAPPTEFTTDRLCRRTG